ncbi:MAG: carboxypeptidase-like regulatory domain-containing protein [Defluviitaleaceae bacterium]|nr:carboxypeptidase-like regulatory domain-containing protein [Defluviitaleaceae bacterium]
MITAYWFNSRQDDAEILSPEFFNPSSQFRIHAELPSAVKFPIHIDISALCMGSVMFNKTYTIENDEAEGDAKFWMHPGKKFFVFGDYVTTLENDPCQLDIKIIAGGDVYTHSIACEYANISGTTTDFSGKPFPAALIFQTYDFGDMGIGIWSDADGNYTVRLPKGEYNSIFVDDDSYGKTSLEAWGWKMIVDSDEVHDFKIGNGEVYSLDVWANNGGFPTLFIAFRPMALSYALKKETRNIEINSKPYTLIDICPHISIDDISVHINGCVASKVSLQMIFETGCDGNALPLYILQIKRLDTIGKQTLVLEYNFTDANGEAIQGQGRTQFNYTNLGGLAIR